MTDSPATLVAVKPGSAVVALRPLLSALEAAHPVRFRPWRPGAPADAVLVVAADGAVPDPPELAELGAPVFAVAGSGAATGSVTVGDEPAVDPRVRGIAFGTEALAGPLAVAPGERVLARAGAGAVWTLSAAPQVVHRVSAVLPELRRGAVLRELLMPESGLALLALVHFLRELTAGRDFVAPPLRATLIFDDPNLRWRSYGFIDYRRLLRHADEHGYHAVMAMIPLDAGRPHGATSALFSERRDRLSLVFHGNDHVKRELMTPTDEAGALAMAAQAMCRVVEFERRYGLAVDRVMTPPHGVASEHVTHALGQVGFDALCTLHALPWTERPRGDLPLAGWGAGEFVGDCAVIPRFAMDSSFEHIALRAFLGQPIVLYGHHDDLRAGLEPLAEAAARVARVGGADWVSTGEIALSNYALRRDGDEAVIRPYSRRIRVAVPEGVSRLRLECPRDSLHGPGLTGWSHGGAGVAGFGDTVAVAPGERIEVRLHASRDVDPAAVDAPPWRPWPQVRRLATEARDRVLPLRRAS